MTRERLATAEQQRYRRGVDGRMHENANGEWVRYVPELWSLLDQLSREVLTGQRGASEATAAQVRTFLSRQQP